MIESAAGGPRLIRPGSGQGVRVYAGENTGPDPAALDRLLHVASLPWVAAPVVALPDLHWKDRLETPSSTAVATRSEIVVGLSSPSQNCGMNLLSTPLVASDLTEDFQDRLMDSIRENLPRRRRHPVLSADEVIQLCRHGAPAAAVRYAVDLAMCDRIEFGGDVFAQDDPSDSQITEAMDRSCIDSGRRSFAFIGGGNHFLELQVVEEVLDREACAAMGIAQGSVVMMFHTGSERLGHDLGRLYSWRRKTDAKKRRALFFRKLVLHAKGIRRPADVANRWRRYFRRTDYVPVPADAPEGERLRLTLAIAANFGYANRVAVTGLIQRALRATTGRKDLMLGIVADLSHNTIHRERIGGEDLWVHRHNAARTVGPSMLPPGHPYAGLGQPVMVPGTNRTSSYVVVGRAGAADSLHSVDHGAGRTVERFAEAGLLRPRTGQVTRCYGYASRNPEPVEHLSDEGIDEVVAIAARCGVAAPAARMRPVAVLKA